MSMIKRLFALAAAGVTAIAIGGALNTSQAVTHVAASGPQSAAIGCTNSSNPGTITFPTTSLGVMSSSLPNSLGRSTSTASLPNATFNYQQPNAVVLCGAVFEDTGTVSTLPVGNLASDNDPSTIDGGTITYSCRRRPAAVSACSTASRPASRRSCSPTPT